ncbi:MAG: type II secretion system protein [Planctomycetota bacterium]
MQTSDDRPSWHAVRLRGAFTTIELLVAMGVMMTVMGVVATLVYRTDRVWKDTSDHRFAMLELSNQLEELTLLPSAQLNERLSHLQPSRECETVLDDSELFGEATEDVLGRRITLELQWQSNGQPVRRSLSGWHRDNDRPVQKGPEILP